MKNTKNAMLLAIATLTLTVGCTAQKDGNAETKGRRGGPPSIEETMKMDADGDGMLSLSEVKGPLKNDFDKIDSNKDGYLTKEELENAPKPERGQGPPRR